ncbi:MAG TPA: glycosyltransferase family 2 protein [Myxococcales bacterium]|jgi:glycosyltransferase involved in cell wall biosynthesis
MTARSPASSAASSAGAPAGTVSVVIPCYGGETLPRALASVAAQTRAPLEVIVVDDASPVPLAAEGARLIRLEHNQGPANARNAGWDAARGTYVAFLDSDDAWHPQKLALQTAVMERNPKAALTATDLFEAIAEPGEPGEPAPFPSIEGEPRVREYARWKALVVNPSHTPTWMVRRDLAHRFPANGRYVEDYLFLLELLLDGQLVLHLEAELACVFKPRLGKTSGLSSHLWRMERGELSAYASLRASGRLSAPTATALQAASLLKFARRLALRAVR